MNINENYNEFSKQELINTILDKNKLINTLQTKKIKNLLIQYQFLNHAKVLNKWLKIMKII